MKNLHEYNEFRNMRTKINESIEEEPLLENDIVEETIEEVEETIEEESINEGAQLFDDIWKVRMRVEIPSSLINSYVKKVKDETGEDPKKKWSEQEIAEEVAKYVTTSFMAIENLPASIVSSSHAQPTIQTEEEMPVQTQVQTEIEPEVPVQEPSPEGQPVPQTQPQGQPVPQTQPVQGAQGAAQTIPQTQAPTAEI